MIDRQTDRLIDRENGRLFSERENYIIERWKRDRYIH